MTPLERLDALDRTKRNAWLAFFAGARWEMFGSKNGDTGKEYPPHFGKAECEWVDDWRDFWGRELVELGFVTFEETEPRPARGMVPGSTCWDIRITPTAEGREAREAWWQRHREAVDREMAQIGTGGVDSGSM